MIYLYYFLTYSQILKINRYEQAHSFYIKDYSSIYSTQPIQNIDPKILQDFHFIRAENIN